MALPPHPSPMSDKQSLLSYESPCHGTTTSQRPRTVPFGLPGTVLVMHASGVRPQGEQYDGRYILPTGTAAWSGCSYAMNRVSSTQNIIQTVIRRPDPPHFPAHVCMMFGRTPCTIWSQNCRATASAVRFWNRSRPMPTYSSNMDSCMQASVRESTKLWKCVHQISGGHHDYTA